MGASVADIFRHTPEIDDFKASVIGLRGDFAFGLDDMIALANAYFALFPDCFSNRTCGDVALGYRIVRVCVIEKLVYVLPERLRDPFRDMLYDINLIENTIRTAVAGQGYEEIRRQVDAVERQLSAIQADIDLIPISMAKERFIGGISYIYNVLYMINNAVKKHEAS